MHQSSLGALMLLAGKRVHPLWQSPWLPFLYLGASTFMSFGCVAGTTMLCCVVWKRAMDMGVLDEARITAWLIFGWLGLGLLDILFRGALGTAFHADRFAGVFWLEMLLINRRLAASPFAADARNAIHVPGLRSQFRRRHGLPFQPHNLGISTQS
jgi:Ni/Fe-hydrogenase subunit HybB-like protein